jgi:hypothetical protein
LPVYLKTDKPGPIGELHGTLAGGVLGSSGPVATISDVTKDKATAETPDGIKVLVKECARADDGTVTLTMELERSTGGVGVGVARKLPINRVGNAGGAIPPIIALRMAGAAGMAGIAVDPNIMSWSSLPANLTMTQAWGLAPVAGWNHPSWSISAEWFAYLSFPPFAWAALKLKDRPLAAVGLVVLWRHGIRDGMLVYAVIALLLVDPFLLHSVAFALSCGASASIALLSRPVGARLPGPRWVREPLAVSIAAQLGVLPVLLWVFDTGVRILEATTQRRDVLAQAFRVDEHDIDLVHAL